MSKPLIKLVSLLMIMAMVLAPMRALTAAVTVSAMDSADQVQLNRMHHSDAMMADDNGEPCDQCDRMQCCQDGDCAAGHCISCMAMVLLAFPDAVIVQSPHDHSTYHHFTISFLSSPLLHPPRN